MSNEPDNWDDPPPDQSPQYGPPPQPGITRAAGIIWVVMAIIFYVFGCLNVVVTAMLAANRPNNAGAGTDGCATYLSFGIGTGLLIAGRNLYNDKSKDVIVASVLSILLGLFYGAVGVLAFAVFAPAGLAGPVVAAIALCVALGTIIPGVMALAGRSQYLAWRAAEREDRRQRYDYDHNYGFEDAPPPSDDEDRGTNKPWDRGNRGPS